MSESNVDARVRDVLVDVLLLDDAKTAAMTRETHILKDLGAESINVAEITVALEKEFDLAIEDEQMRGLYTVGALVDFIAVETRR